MKENTDATIRIGQDIRCLPYAGFLKVYLEGSLTRTILVSAVSTYVHGWINS